ncbi:MAG TPA: hypothetical protein VGB84_09230 [Arachidicoccus sp.]
MGATKTAHFTDKQNTIAMLAKALDILQELAVMEYLLKANEVH